MYELIIIINFNLIDNKIFIIYKVILFLIDKFDKFKCKLNRKGNNIGAIMNKTIKSIPIILFGINFGIP